MEETVHCKDVVSDNTKGIPGEYEYIYLVGTCIPSKPRAFVIVGSSHL